jgi:hypothetical protein
MGFIPPRLKDLKTQRLPKIPPTMAKNPVQDGILGGILEKKWKLFGFW